MQKILLLIFSLSSLLHGLHLAPLTRESVHKLVINTSIGDLLLEQYMQSFPFDDYEVVYSNALGWFFVEKQSEDMIKRVIREGWHREGHVLWPLEPYIRPGSNVIDAGGHVGTHTVVLSHRVGASGHVYVFEPQVKIFAELAINLHLNGRENVIAYRAALGNKNGFIEMNPSCPSNEGGVGVGRGGDRAPLLRLDDLRLENVSVIKIDVEGMEMEVLEGARDTIERNRPVMAIEIMNDVQERISQIEQMGYTVSHLGMEDYLCIPLNLAAEDHE